VSLNSQDYIVLYVQAGGVFDSTNAGGLKDSTVAVYESKAVAADSL
jgi:hypothetical protein